MITRTVCAVCFSLSFRSNFAWDEKSFVPCGKQQQRRELVGSPWRWKHWTLAESRLLISNRLWISRVSLPKPLIKRFDAGWFHQQPRVIRPKQARVKQIFGENFFFGHGPLKASVQFVVRYKSPLSGFAGVNFYLLEWKKIPSLGLAVKNQMKAEKPWRSSSFESHKHESKQKFCVKTNGEDLQAINNMVSTNSFSTK